MKLALRGKATRNEFRRRDITRGGVGTISLRDQADDYMQQAWRQYW
jgi:hypothetical protein